MVTWIRMGGLGLVVALSVLGSCAPPPEPLPAARLEDFVARMDATADAAGTRAIQDEWLTAVRELQEAGRFATGTELEAVEAMLGTPTDRGDDWVEWYLDGPGHINPSVVASTNGMVVTGLQITAR